jgi:hypothetical protein
MIALNPQPLPPHADAALTTDVAALVRPATIRPGLGGCPTCTSGRFLIFQNTVDGVNPAPLQVILPNVSEAG